MPILSVKGEVGVAQMNEKFQLHTRLIHTSGFKKDIIKLI
jgi:hypothetical protein